MKKRIPVLLLVLALLIQPMAWAAGDNTSLAGYQDHLAYLDAGEMKALYEDLLGNVLKEYAYLDVENMTDRELAGLYYNLRFTGFAGLSELFIVPEGEVSALLRTRFGRTPDYSSFTLGHVPTPDERYEGVWYHNGSVYFPPSTREENISYTYFQVAPLHLYLLGGGRYFAVFTERHGEEGFEASSVRWAVVELEYGVWRALAVLPADTAPTQLQLSHYGLPSNWAVGEIGDAEALGLIPDLAGDSGYWSTATRLQFAQLAVRLVEKYTGQSLPLADENYTFVDCRETAALKAYQVEIVNGTGPGYFTPDGPLSRAEMATMLWRAVNYIRRQTGTAAFDATGDLSRFTDVGRVPDWAAEGLAGLTANGVMKGTGETTLSPMDSCTVEQAILLCLRTYQRLRAD